MSRLIALALVGVALSAGFMHFCRSAQDIEREQRELIRHQAEWFRQWMIDQGFIVDAFGEGGSLVIITGPRWSELDAPSQQVDIGYLADHFCNDRTAPVLIRSGNP